MTQARRTRRIVTVRPQGANYEVRILGTAPTPLRDFYHALLRLTWWASLSVITTGYLAVNALYACAYLAAGGIENAEPGSFTDALFFSVQTMGTIGYGAMYPKSELANWLVVSESVVSLLLTALSTGLVFAKFSRPTSRVLFSRHAVICPFNGAPTLMLRVGNERGNAIVDVQFRAVLTRTERTLEGELFYRTYDLTLVRDRTLSLTRSFSLSHPIDAQSPLYGLTAEQAAAQEVEVNLMLVGIDDTAMQTVHARHQYQAHDILWNTRLSDILSEAEDGALIVDLHKFHDVEPLK